MIPGAKRGKGHSEVWKMRGENMARIVIEIADLLSMIDELLEGWGDVLNWSQPPRPGKLGVRWWKHSGKSEMREPVLVVWNKNKLGRFYPIQIDAASWSRRVKKGGGFRHHEDITREVVHYVAELMRVRIVLKEALSYNPALNNVVLKRHGDVVGFQFSRKVEVVDLLKDSLQKLKEYNAGAKPPHA